jgi:hypothetical protein
MMLPAFLRSSLSTALLLAAAGSPGAQGPVPLLQTGDVVAGVGNVTVIRNLAVNDHGDWIVEAITDHGDLDGDTVLIRNGVLYLREGQSIAPVGATLDVFDSINLNASGHSAWNFFIAGTGGFHNNSGLYHDSRLLIQEGAVSTAPGFTPGTPYTGFFDAKINDSRMVLLVATLDDPNIASSIDQAIVICTLDGSGNLISERVIAREGDLLPGQTAAAEGFGTGPHSCAVNSLGDVLFLVDTAAATVEDEAIYLNDTLLAQENAPSPVAGRSWSSLLRSELDLNDNRDHVFSGELDGPDESDHLIVRSGVEFRQEGDTLPAIAPHVISHFGNAPVLIANSGEVLWYGDWDDPDLDSDTGLFLDDALLVREGVTTVGGVFVEQIGAVPGSFTISPNGRFVVFTATLRNGKQGAYRIDRASRASTAVRNGAGSNALVYTSTNMPVLGTTWTAEVDNHGHDGAATIIIGYAAPTDRVFLQWGELLVDPSAIPLLLSLPGASPTHHANPIPADPVYLGAEVFTQAVIVATSPVLTNAVDLVLGY